MFAQFIEGRVTDAQQLFQQLERWRDEVAGEAPGWLGATAGVTDDGTAFLTARFASSDDARANADRPEQSAWWAETEKCFQTPPSFMDCDEVEQFRGGGSDDAGFVQVIRGTVNDVAAARDFFLEETPEGERPDVIGGFTGLLPDGSYTSVVYFTSEEEARAGEADEAAAGDKLAEQMLALHDTPPRFLDLRNPWFASP
jgi:hypothetical protein